MSDIYGDLLANGYQPKENEDGFEPVNGKYVCRIDTLGRVGGVSERTGNAYDFYSGNIQVVEVIDGDKAMNRYFKLNYNNDEDGIKKLLDDLFTAGITLSAKSQEEMDVELPGLKDKIMNVRAWARPKMRKEGDEWVEVEPKEMKQHVRVVKGFGKVKSGTDTVVPF